VLYVLSAVSGRVVCVYLPYEDGYANINAFSDEVSHLENLIDNNLDCHVVICGDFNVDFSRNWLHTEILSSFCDNMNIKPVYGHFNCNIDYTYNFDMSRFNTLDHFLLSGVLYEKCVDGACVLHEVDNLSDHDPILLELSLDVQYVGFAANVYTPRASWKKASNLDLFNYRLVLSQNLTNLDLDTDVLTCHNVNCKKAEHFRALAGYACGITDACLDACKNAIPCTTVKQKSGRMAGWSEYVQPLRDKSLFWHNLWVDNGRPHSGAVADCMRRSRAAYHYAVRFIKKDEDNIRCERIADIAAMNDDRNFWTEVKKIRSRKPARVRTVDGAGDDNGIAQLFASNYRDLYSCVSYNKSEMTEIIQENDVNLFRDGFTSDYIVEVCDVKKAVSNLKAHKSDGSFDLSTDHFLNAGDELYVHVALLFSAILVHGFSPSEFCTSTIIPIPKGSNVNVTDSANYRGIALSSIYIKIFDHVVLQRYHDYFLPQSCSLVLKRTTPPICAR